MTIHQLFQSEDPEPILGIILHGRLGRCELATRHPIRDGKLQPGSYIQPESLLDMVSGALANGASSKGRWADPRVLFEDADQLVWFRRAAPHPLYFRRGEKVAALSVRFPTLVFRASKAHTNLAIYATAGVKRPTPRTLLYHAPVFNLNSAGDLCFGDAVSDWPDDVSHQSLDQMADCFLKVCGSHTNHDQTLRGSRTSDAALLKFWKKKALNGASVLASEMQPMGKRLEAVV